MDQLKIEHMEIYVLKKVFNDICEQDYSHARRLIVLIQGKYSRMQYLIEDLKRELELDFEHIHNLQITCEDKNGDVQIFPES